MLRFVPSFVVALALVDCGGATKCEWGSDRWAAGECGETTCRKVARAASEYLKQAKACDPKSPRQCTKTVGGSANGCPTFVNAENTAAIELLTAASRRQDAMSCFDDLDDTLDCLFPEWSLCSAEGQCVDELDFYGKACKVNGQNYLHGTRDIPGLFGCGSCVCEDGSLSCTGDEACEGACPPDTAPGSQCDKWDTFDATRDRCDRDQCQVVELACLKVCETICDVGTCVDGMCRNVCD